MINPILETEIQKSELWNLKSEFGNQKSETRIQKSQIAIHENLKSTIEKSEIKSLSFRNATCDIKFWESRFIPVCDVNVSNIDSIKSSTFSLRGG